MGALIPRWRSRMPSPRSATARASAPCATKTGSQLGGAVAVAVGLDHGEDLPARPHELAHGPDVRGGGIEVDLEDGRPGRARRGCGGHGGLLTREKSRVAGRGRDARNARKDGDHGPAGTVAIRAAPGRALRSSRPRPVRGNVRRVVVDTPPARGKPMKVSFFETARYRAPEALPPEWPVPSGRVRPRGRRRGLPGHDRAARSTSRSSASTG